MLREWWTIEQEEQDRGKPPAFQFEAWLIALLLVAAVMRGLFALSII
jgi:hypothetical protein